MIVARELRDAHGRAMIASGFITALHLAAGGRPEYNSADCYKWEVE
jgi:hypothetical protein